MNSLFLSVRSTLFRKTMLLYSFAVFIPIVVFFLFCYSAVYHSFEKEIYTSNINKLNTVKNVYDVKISELRTLTEKIDGSPSMTMFQIQNHPDGVVSTLSFLTRLLDPLSDIFLYERGSNKLFSSSGTFFFSHVLPNYIASSDLEFEEFYSLVNHSDSAIIRRVISPNDQSYLFYFSPLSPNFSNPSRTVVFVIDNEKLKQLFNFSVQEDANENVLVFDKDLQLLSSFVPDSKGVIYNHISPLLKQHNGDFSDTIHADGQKLYVIALHSEATGYYYVKITDMQYAMKSLIQIKDWVIVVTALLFTIGAVIIILGLKFNYFPIQKIALQLKAYSNTRNDELGTIERAIGDLNQLQVDYRNFTEHSEDALYENLLLSVLNSSFNNLQSLNSAGKRIGVFFSKSEFCIASIYIEDVHILNKIGYSDVVKSIAGNIPKSVECQFKNLLFNQQIVGIFCLERENYRDLIQAFEAILQQLLELGVLATVGVSDLNEKPSLIGKLYLQSREALEYKMLYSIGSTIEYRQISHITDTEAPLPEMLRTFGEHLSDLKIEKAQKSFYEMMNYMKTNKCTLYTCRYVCFDIIQYFKRLSILLDTAYSNTLDYGFDILEIENFQTVDDLIELIEQVFQKISDFLNSHKKQQSDQLIEEILQYINENGLKYEFQISSLADRFSMSVQYLRSIFKTHTGQTLSEYVNSLKIEKAKELLLTTNDSLAVIVQKIGKIDVTNFSRGFKKETGLTPGAYRLAHQENKKKDE
ncbi:helix-turn-helix transcriptional regulator [Paenibacillus sp. IB182496]|uniref:Helix-turn-helix transcriptional regulator n=1 Tax=Paenibacillus sabuli TaxID=2772509 RepID=A0A927BQ13_9BACL|nr:helix-turn-helix domain-containing protein [Paenibacillus sabuli]MBD2844162.1 helix-turn-helix transcriptional regulator [Paenibacillus sabuli]